MEAGTGAYTLLAIAIDVVEVVAKQDAVLLCRERPWQTSLGSTQRVFRVEFGGFKHST